MSLHVIKDGQGLRTGIFIPISDWEMITEKHEDLKQLIPTEAVTKRKLSELAGKLSSETVAAMQKHVTDSRNEWEERLNKHVLLDTYLPK